jgi:hypothetical protein
MIDKLLVAVLGNENSGKSTTWTRLFDPTAKTTVKTGKHLCPLYLNPAQYVEVFLISGSPVEREIEVGEILPDGNPEIVLCSAQYHQDVTETFVHFFGKGYEVFVQWLNPGYHDAEAYQDSLGLRDFLLNKGTTLQVRDGRADPAPRVKELRKFILGWAKYCDLVATEFPA